MPGAKPLALHKAEGTYRPDRHGESATNLLETGYDLTPLSPAPEWFDDKRKEYWVAVLQSAPPGLFKTTDIVTVMLLCDNLADIEKAQGDLKAHGDRTTNNNGGESVSPSYRIKKDAQTVVIALLKECGMTPASRARVIVQATEGDEVDPWKIE